MAIFNSYVKLPESKTSGHSQKLGSPKLWHSRTPTPIPAYFRAAKISGANLRGAKKWQSPGFVPDIPMWVCLKMLCTPKPTGFADHYPY